MIHWYTAVNLTMSAQKITIEGFLEEFKQRHDQMADRPFCWVLGSGASIQSGIPSGKDLALQWLTELHKREDFDRLPIDEWATAENLGIPGFEYARAANFYPWIYQRRFRDYKEQGYAFLEKTMDHAEPSFGYSVLAQIMATTPHKVAVTTNFDNLIADALSIYTRVFPLVCGHESLTGYIRANLRRPLVAKVHRDLLLAPLNNPDELDELPKEWAAALTKIFDRFSPIVLGYGGNDGSLMGFLETLAPIEGGIFWCYLEGSQIDQRIQGLIAHHSGRLVPIAGFNEIMLQLQETLQLPFLLPVLESVHNKRAADYQKQFEALTKALRKPGEDAAAERARKPVREAAEAAVQRLTKEKNWWAWQLKADSEEDPERRESIFRDALNDFPQSHELMENFANFLTEALTKHDEAEKLYRAAIKLNPDDKDYTVNLGLFMENVRKDYDEAEALYRKGHELDPDDADNTGNLALFLHMVRMSYDEAEALYRKAQVLDPSHANNTGNLALFLHEVRRNYDEAEALYRKSLELDVNHANNTGNLALFIYDVRRNYDEAEALYRKAIELDPSNANNTVNFAVFMKNVRKDYDEAEALYRKAMELDPKHAGIISGLALFMERVRKNYVEAEQLYRKALEVDPDRIQAIVNFAQFLGARERIDEANGMAARAWQRLGEVPQETHAEIALTRWLLDRASGRSGSPALGRLKTVLLAGFERAPWSFDELLAALTPKLVGGDRTLAPKITEAILDENKVAALEEESIWKAVDPIPLEVRWD